MEVNLKFNMLEYLVVVQAIADGYFTAPEEDEDEETFVPQYVPHYGRLNAMRIFYNACVTESKYDKEIKHDIGEDFSPLDKLMEDEEFCHAFGSALTSYDYNGLVFGNAYADAMKIVEQRLNTAYSAVAYMQKIVKKAKDLFGNLFDEENLGFVQALAEELKNGNISNEGIVEAFGKSGALDKIINIRTAQNKPKKKQGNPKKKG